jgi:hypothetical protein
VRIVLLLAVLAAPAAAEETWVLQTGPDAADSVPLKPIQPVDAWRCLYTDGDSGVWIYATRSPNFFPPASADVRRVPGTPWTVAAFFPEDWSPARKTAWLDIWQNSVVSLATFPQPGRPVFPAVLKLPGLTKG